MLSHEQCTITTQVFVPSWQEAVGDTLEELWISYNQIEKLKGINVLKKMKILYMSNNSVRDWAEFNKLVRNKIISFFLYLYGFITTMIYS